LSFVVLSVISSESVFGGGAGPQESKVVPTHRGCEPAQEDREALRKAVSARPTCSSEPVEARKTGH